LTKSHEHRPDTEDIAAASLGRALWRAKGWIVGLAIGAGIITFIGLSMVRPLFTSEARILIQNDQSWFTRPASDQGREQQAAALDEQAVRSQVQVLTSRDLVVQVIRALDLTNSAEFAKDAGVGPFKRYLNRLGLGRESPKSEEEKAATAFAEHLSVFPLAKSSVIGVEYTSGDSSLAPKAANKLADLYIDWQREAKLEQIKDATAWLGAQIEVLRKKVAESEAAAEQAEVASARESSLRTSLNDVKTQASGLSEAEIKLRALEREAKANRDLLESYLARYRDASERHDMGAVPAQAVIVSRAHASVLPSFPKRGPLTLLVTAATALLALAYVLARELIGAPAERREPLRANESLVRERRVSPARPTVASAQPFASAQQVRPASAAPPEAPPSPDPATPNPSSGGLSAAADVLDRLRRGLSLGPSEPPAAEPTSLRPNDLRHYLNQRLAAAASEPANGPVRNGSPPAAKVGSSKVGPVLKSLDAVLNHILASWKGGTPRAVLVAGVSAKVDATPEAIEIARSLVARREQVVLLDVTSGATAVSGPLGLPRAPGFTDLAAGLAGFEDVVRIDADTPLQVITTGNPKVKAKGEETDRFARIFEALTQVYDCVVLHADREAVRNLTPALKFELPVVVVVLLAGAAAKSAAEDLKDFSALGCPVVVYEQNGKEPRSGLLNRVAAI